jgi:serralysin
VTFAFRASDTTSYDPGPGDQARLDAQQIQMALLSFQSWSDLANIKFQRVGTGTSGEAAYSDNASMLVSTLDNNETWWSGGAYLPGQDGTPGNRAASSEHGDIYFNNQQPVITDPEVLNRGMLVYTHEIGHAIGLSHPGDYNRAPGVPIDYEDHADYAEDTAGFGSTADRPWFSIANGAAPVIFCAWDAGGRDTFNFAGYAQDQKIDLGQGKFSDVGALTGNVSVAFGTVIEDAVGGSGDDTMIGNSASNALTGNAGADSLAGLGGNDTLKGGTGADRLDGGAGFDTIVFGVVAAGLTVNLAAGTVAGDGGDTLVSVENAVGSRFDDVLSGNGSANSLDGAQGSDTLAGAGGVDRLIGGKHADQLTGGARVDTFVYLAATDSVRKAPDLIADLTAEDRIDLSAIDADSTQGGDQAFELVARLNGQAGQACLRWNSILEVTELRADLNGDGKPELLVHIEGDLTSFDNFVL